MATSTMVALSEYLRTSYSPDCEWVDGEVRERNMGEGSHAVVQSFFIKYFGRREEEWGIRVLPELRTQVSATHFRVPDVLLMRSSDPFEEIVRTPPLLCIEVLSPEDRMTEMQDKIDDYCQMGVKAVWVVDPVRRKAFSVEEGALTPVADLTVPGTPIEVSVTEVFEELNRLGAGRY